MRDLFSSSGPETSDPEPSGPEHSGVEHSGVEHSDASGEDPGDSKSTEVSIPQSTSEKTGGFEGAGVSEKAPQESKSVFSLASSAARLLPSLSNGDLATLRRTGADGEATPVLWKVLYQIEGADTPGPWGQDTWERRWAVLIAAMGRAAKTEDFYDPSMPIGKALFEAGWSEIRLVRLLRARSEALGKEVRRLSQFLASKNVRADYPSLAGLLFYQSGEAASRYRRALSRAYYRAEYKSKQ